VMASLNGSSAPSVPPPIRPEYAPESEPPDTPHTPHTPNALHTPSDTLTAEDYGREWKESGEHWQRVAEWIIARRETQRRRASQDGDDALYRTMANEGRAITLGGFGAGLFVKNGQLVVKQGAAYSTQPDTTETLARGLHDLLLRRAGPRLEPWGERRLLCLCDTCCGGRFMGCSPDHPAATSVIGFGRGTPVA